MLADTISAVRLHIDRAEAAQQQILAYKKLTADIYKDFEKVKTIDAFIYRFIKTQDLIGEKLFKEYLTSVGDYKDDMTMLDVLNKLEKQGILESALLWMDYRNLRNMLTHEYPDNEEEILQGIETALMVFDNMKKIYLGIINSAQSRNLL